MAGATYIFGLVYSNPNVFAGGGTIEVQPTALVYGSNTGVFELYSGSFTVNVQGAVFGNGSSSSAIWGRNSSNSNINVSASGSLFGHSGAIWIGELAQVGFINNFGSIQTDSATISAIYITSSQNNLTISNYGLIAGSAAGAITFAGSSLSSIINYGAITAASGFNAIESTSDTAEDHITNHGVITGGISLGGGDDSLVNKGKITGLVELGAGEDTFEGSNNPDVVDVVNGDDGDDSLSGFGGNDGLYGGQGNDTIEGGAGDDTLDGGSGEQTFGDTVTYEHATTGVTVDLSSTDPQNTRGAGTDTLSGFENLTGSDFADVLYGNNGANVIFGRDGKDTLFGGGGSGDILSGGTESDVYIARAGDVIFEIAGQGTADRVKALEPIVLAADAVTADIEFLEAENAASTAPINLTGNGTPVQTITGNAGINTLKGLAGIDTLKGLGGNDTLVGGTGKDTLYGGTGRDVFKFAAGDSRSTAFDVVKDYAKGALNAGDKFDFSSALKVGGTSGAVSSGAASINAANGIASFASGSGTTMADCIHDIAARINAGGTQAGEFAFFKVNKAGPYYLFISDAVNGAGANDVVVQLANVSLINTIKLSGGDLTILS